MGLSELLQKKKFPEILKALYEKPSHVRGLRERIGGSASTIQSRIREMEDEELVEERREEDFPFKKILELTDTGKNIADILRNFEGIEQRRRIETVVFEREKERLKWPLLILLCPGNQGNTKIQKLAFLGKKELGFDIPYYFRPYKHGPFSKELARDVGRLMTLELVDPLERHFNLTKEGREIAQEVYEGLNQSERKAFEKLKKYSRMSLHHLLNYLYGRYPEDSGSPLP